MSSSWMFKKHKISYAEYMIKDEGKAFVQALNEVSCNTAKEEVQSIRTLAGKGVASVEVLSKDDATLLAVLSTVPLPMLLCS